MPYSSSLNRSIIRLLVFAFGNASLVLAAPAADAPAPEYVPLAYPLDACVVSDQPLGSMGEPAVIDYEGRELRFCCAGCEPQFRAEPAGYLAKIDAAVIARQKPHYPLDRCLVMPEDVLDQQTVDHVHQGRLVRFCCDGCIDEFDADPQAYIDTLNRAVIAAQEPTYPLMTCVVSGDELDPQQAVNVVVGDRLVRLCCPGCIDTLEADPAAYLRKLDEAGSASHNSDGRQGHEHQRGGHDHSH